MVPACDFSTEEAEKSLQVQGRQGLADPVTFLPSFRYVDSVLLACQKRATDLIVDSCSG